MAVSDEATLVGVCGARGRGADDGEYELDGQRQIRRRRRVAMTRGLNQNHNRVVKDVFKSVATAAAARTGALQDWYHDLLKRGMREELARVTLARKLAALVETGRPI